MTRSPDRAHVVTSRPRLKFWWALFCAALTVVPVVIVLLARPPGTSREPTMRVHLINVGQGAATLVEFSCGAVLVDTGGESNAQFESEPRLLAYLDAFFKSRPDLHGTLALLVITHNHVDHDRSAAEVARRYKVKHVVTNGLTTSSGGRQQQGLLDEAHEEHAEVDNVRVAEVPQQGLHNGVIDPLACSDIDPDIRALWGAVSPSDVDWPEAALKNANDDSVVIKFTLGKASFLITGDLELDGIDALLKKYAGTAELQAEVYEVGHHGSWNATTAALLEAIHPSLALIGVGNAARQETWSAYAYGHPRLSTIELLKRGLHGSPRASVHVPLATRPKQFVDREVTAPIYATGWSTDENVIVTLRPDGTLRAVTHASP